MKGRKEEAGKGQNHGMCCQCGLWRHSEGKGNVEQSHRRQWKGKTSREYQEALSEGYDSMPILALGRANHGDSVHVRHRAESSSEVGAVHMLTDQGQEQAVQLQQLVREGRAWEKRTSKEQGHAKRPVRTKDRDLNRRAKTLLEYDRAVYELALPDAPSACGRQRYIRNGGSP